MGMQGIDRRLIALDAYRVRTQSRKTLFNMLIAKLTAKAKAIVSPYFKGEPALVPVFA